MSLHVEEPPRTALQRIVASLARLHGLKTAHPLNSYTVAAPHRMYEVALTDLATRRGLGAKRFVGWRYLVFAPDNSVVAAHLATSHPRRVPLDAELNFGPFVGGTRKAIALAERLKQVKTSRYRLSLLHVPGLYLMALWLRHARASDRDLIVPIEPKPSWLPRRVYPVGAFAEKAAARARDRLSYGSGQGPAAKS